MSGTTNPLSADVLADLNVIRLTHDTLQTLIFQDNTQVLLSIPIIF